MGECDMARPWGMDALSTSTAETATDAPRPSIHPSLWRTKANSRTIRKHSRTLPSITPSIPYIICLHSFILSFLWLGQRPVKEVMLWSSLPVGWPLTLTRLMPSLPGCLYVCTLICFFLRNIQVNAIEYCCHKKVLKRLMLQSKEILNV